MIKELCITENLACIHSITPEGGGGKSKHNNNSIGIYERFKFNIDKRVGLATSIVKDSMGHQKKFGAQGLVIYDGKINNVNRSDAGSVFNDSKGLWESPEGIQYPTIDQLRDEINTGLNTYVEINIYEYSICGFFLDFTQIDWCIASIGDFNKFYENTKDYELPYYGFTNCGIGKINVEHMQKNDIARIEEVSLVTIERIYNSVKFI